MKNKTTPALTLEEIPGSNTAENRNAYGFKTIRIWEFNYDGKGAALASYDNADEIDSIHPADLNIVLCGDPGTGHRWYRPVNLCLDEPNAASK